MRVGEDMSSQELLAEINRLKKKFEGADENKLEALEGLIEQAAHERIYLKRLNEQATVSGFVVFHPENVKLQRTLPVSIEIARHSACYSNIMDKLMKHLGVEGDDEDDGLDEYT